MLSIELYPRTFPYEKEPLLMWNPSSVGSSSLSDLDEQTLAKSSPRRQ